MLREFYLAHECISDHVPRRCVLVRYVNRHDEQHHLGNRYQVAAKDGFTYTYTHDLDNQYTHIHGEYVWGLTEDAYPEYDDNGNLQTDKWGRQYSYDYRNRLTEIGDVQYGYDALGRRVSKYDENNNLTTYFYYDTFGRVIAEYEKPNGGDEAFARSFVYGNGIDEVLAMFLPEKSFDPNDVIELAAFCEDWLTSNATYDFDSSGVVDFNDFAVLAADGASLPTTKETRFYYLKDALGSVVGIVGGKFQRAEDREFYLYDVYGKPSESSMPSAAGNPYFFTGRRLDPESGLYYYRARTYDPETGRFLQTDPIGYADSMNLYQYVLSNPTNWVDPLGLLYGWMHPGGKSLPQAGDPIDPITKTLSETAGTVAMVPFVFKAQLDCVGGGICDFLSDPKGNMSMLLDSLGQFSEGVIERNVEIYIKVKDSSQPLKTFAQEEIKWGKDFWGPVGINALEGFCDQIDRAASDDFWESCKGRAEITIVITQFYYAGKGVLQAGKQVINNADNLADDIIINSRQAAPACRTNAQLMEAIASRAEAGLTASARQAASGLKPNSAYLGYVTGEGKVGLIEASSFMPGHQAALKAGLIPQGSRGFSIVTNAQGQVGSVLTPSTLNTGLPGYILPKSTQNAINKGLPLAPGAHIGQ